MTIAIGLVCSDGVLVASDSMGSAGKTAQSRVKVYASPTAPTVWTYAGSQYMSQQIEACIEGSGAKDGRHLPDVLVPQVEETLRSAYGRMVLPPGASERDLLGHAPDVLILGWHDGVPSFRRIPSELASVSCDAERLVAVGTGREYASVVKAALAHYLDESVSLHLGKVLAFRVVQTVCDVSAYNVAMPVQMAVADTTGARILSSTEVAEVGILAERWVATERGSLERAFEAGAGEVADDLPALRRGDLSDRQSR